MTAAHRFTDRDVRERPDLVADAVCYLRWYQGDFEFLLDAKFYEQQYGTIPLPTARGVLNCMRHDARYAMVNDDLPEPLGYIPEPAERLRGEQNRRGLRVVREEREHRWPKLLKTTWRARLFYSVNGEVVHALRLDSSIKYFPLADEKFSLDGGVKAMCGGSPYATRYVRLTKEMPPGMRFCRRCHGAIVEKGYDWGETTPPPEVSVPSTCCIEEDS